MKYLLVLFAFLLGCGSDYRKEKQPPQNLDNSLTPYLDDFLKQSELHEVEIHYNLQSLVFKDGDLIEGRPNTIAVCHYMTDHKGNRVNQRVEVSTVHWKRLTSFQRKITMMHEFGHCLLDRDHYDTLFWDDEKMYFSIMVANLKHKETDRSSESVLLDELFHPEKYHDIALHGNTVGEEDHCFPTENGEITCPFSSGA